MLVNRINSKSRIASHCERKGQRASPGACKWLTRATASLREVRRGT
jgi:hypothetical protein